jgi:hypothetical protein
MHFPDVKLNPARQRVVIGYNRKPFVYDIPQDLLELATLDQPLWVKQVTANAFARNGLVVDVPIDVWGWGAHNTITARRMYGYIWTPSALMPNIQLAPGLICGGLPVYDAAAPPEGAILVPPFGSLLGE